jgi:hypothetical protein
MFMHFFKNFSVPLAFLLSSISFISSNAYAAPPAPPGPPVSKFANAPCLDGNNIICIKEVSISNNGEYQIYNGSTSQIFAFGVTNDNTSSISSTLSGWSSQRISKSSWNQSPTGTPIMFRSGMWLTGTNSVKGYPALGSFESLFGSQAQSVNFYWNDTLGTNPLVSGVTLSGFQFTGPIASNVAVFGTGGTLLSQSPLNTAAVPEPETYGMMLLGLGLLGFASRRKQA